MLPISTLSWQGILVSTGCKALQKEAVCFTTASLLHIDPQVNIYHRELKLILSHLCAHIGQTGPRNPLMVVRWMRWPCPVDIWFEIRALAVLDLARSTVMVTEAPHNIEYLRVSRKETFRLNATECHSWGSNPRSPTFQTGSLNHWTRSPALDRGEYSVSLVTSENTGVGLVQQEQGHGIPREDYDVFDLVVTFTDYLHPTLIWHLTNVEAGGSALWHFHQFNYLIAEHR